MSTRFPRWIRKLGHGQGQHGERAGVTGDPKAEFCIYCGTENAVSVAKESKALALLFWLFGRKLYMCRRCGAAFHLPRSARQRRDTH